jgi:serine/threonine protein phosphatase PrpC
MEPQEAVDRTLDLLDRGMNPPVIAARLGDLAIRLGSSDNVTVIVVLFARGGEDGNGQDGAALGHKGEDK